LINYIGQIIGAEDELLQKRAEALRDEQYADEPSPFTRRM